MIEDENQDLVNEVGNSGNEAQINENITQDERKFTQNELNKVVQRVKEKYERKLQAMNNDEQNNANQYSQQVQQQPSQPSAPSIDEEALAQRTMQKMNEMYEKQRQEDYLRQVAENYGNKLTEGHSKYEDFGDVVGKIDPDKFFNAMVLASNHDGGSDIIYELAKNPMKLASINSLAQADPNLALSEMSKLAESVKQNRLAAEEAEKNKVNSPLDRLNPSRATTSSSGNESISDLRSKSYLRG